MKISLLVLSVLYTAVSAQPTSKEGCRLSFSRDFMAKSNHSSAHDDIVMDLEQGDDTVSTLNPVLRCGNMTISLDPTTVPQGPTSPPLPLIPVTFAPVTPISNTSTPVIPIPATSAPFAHVPLSPVPGTDVTVSPTPETLALVTSVPDRKSVV